MTQSQKTITKLLISLGAGERSAVDKLFPMVYHELRQLAQSQLKGERKHHTLNATALVHEAYLKLVDKSEANWRNRAQFFAVAAKSMRQILIDYARKRKAEKRGGNLPLVTFDEQSVKREARAEELVALDEVLRELQKSEQRASTVVELKFFGGLTYEEIAEVLGISVPTVRRDWRFAQAWLSDALRS
jgi:RNA polymerase sigma factor (TIGR02999 family)